MPMRHCFPLLLTALFAFTPASAAAGRDPSAPIPAERDASPAPQSALPASHSWQADASLHAALRTAATGTAIRISDIPLPGDPDASFDLERFEILTPDAAVIAVGPDGRSRTIDPDVILLRGMRTGDPASRVFLGISADALHGYLVNASGAAVLFTSGPHRVEKEALLDARTITARTRIRRTDDLVRDLHLAAHPDAPPHTFSCGADGAMLGRLRPLPDTAHELEPADLDGEAIAQSFGGPCRMVRVLIDTDWAFTGSLFGGDPYASSGYALILMGAVSEIYRHHVDARLAVPYLRVFTTDNDPWSPANMFELLDQFRDYWRANEAPVRWELAHLLAGTPLGGGVAYLNVVCSDQWGFGVSTGLAGTFPYPTINHSHSNWDPFVVAHELGHNFGTGHTHDDYAPPVDNCGNGDCAQAYGGTIMSYCHTCSGGMSNIRLEFHPRVAQRIDAYLNTVPCDIEIVGVTARDDSFSAWPGEALLMDVLRNDEAYSCDDPVIDSFDPVSVLGGTVEFHPASSGFPRDRLRYTPPADATGHDALAYTLAGGGTALVTIELRQLRPADTPAQTLPGAAASYYVLNDPVQLPDFTQLTPYAHDVLPNVNIPSTNGNFATSGLADQVGAIFTGYIDIPTGGVWTLYTESDDGSRLLIGDTVVVENDGLHGMVERSGSIGLDAGRHKIRIEFFERFGGAGLIARWSGPSLSKQVISANRWSHALPCHADLSGDGIVDFNDLLEVLAAWGPCPSGCTADLDGSGDVDLADLFMLLATWGPCP